jgi:hypothetical protein
MNLIADRWLQVLTASAPRFYQRDQCKSAVRSYDSVHLLKISDPLVPPKPNELESATSIGALRAAFGT